MPHLRGTPCTTSPRDTLSLPLSLASRACFYLHVLSLPLSCVARFLSLEPRFSYLAARRSLALFWRAPRRLPLFRFPSRESHFIGVAASGFYSPPRLLFQGPARLQPADSLWLVLPLLSSPLQSTDTSRLFPAPAPLIAASQSSRTSAATCRADCLSRNSINRKGYCRTEAFARLAALIGLGVFKTPHCFLLAPLDHLQSRRSRGEQTGQLTD